MNKKRKEILGIIEEVLINNGIDPLHQEQLEEMDSITYISALCDLEDRLGIEMPDELLTKNVFIEIGILAEYLETYMSL